MLEHRTGLNQEFDPMTGNFKDKNKKVDSDNKIEQQIKNLKKLREEFPQFYPETINEIKKWLLE